MLTKEKIDEIQSSPTNETVKRRWIERNKTSTGYGMTFEFTELKAQVDSHDLVSVCNQALAAIDLAAENERLKQDLAALTDVKRIADNLAEMNKIKYGEDNDLFKRIRIKAMEENNRLKQQLTSLTGVYDDLAKTARYHEERNERLKAKLDAVRNQATEWIRATDGINQFTALYLNARAKDILAIIDKEDAT
jgi:hypothetical protein